MWIVFTVLIGLVVGVLAKVLMPGRDPGGFFLTILIGIAGALVAGYLGRVMGWYVEGQPVGFVASVIGAMLILGVFRIVRGRSSY